MKNYVNKIILVVIALLFCSCANEQVKIGLSKGSGGESYENYSKWLKQYDENIEIVDLYTSENPIELLNECDGLILTGGPDVHPGRFDKPYESDRCSIDEKRDTLEFSLLQKALLDKVPILGICRGQQLINVALGGSLIIDIPTDLNNPVVHQIEEGDAKHRIFLEEDSYLYSISGVDSSLVNSNHHQGIDRLSKEFKPTGFTRDGIIEAYEWKDNSFKSWLLAVQWHPERLDKEHKMSAPLAKEFIKASKDFRTKYRKK